MFGLLVLLGILIAIVLFVVYYKSKTPEDYTVTGNTPCVCAFDLDHTLSCGDPKPIVDMCKAKGCRLAINTARPSNWVSDIPLDAYGFEKPWYDQRDHYYNTRSLSQTSEQIAEVKSNYLQLLKDKYKIAEKQCVILFDDAPTNLSEAKMRGFSTIPASDSECGIHYSKMSRLADILRKC